MLTTILSCALALVAGWQPSAGDEVIAREQQRVRFLTERNYDALTDLLSPTLTYTHSSAKLDTRDTLLADLRAGRLVYKSLTHRDVQVRLVTADVAILNGVSDVESIVGGQPTTTPLRFTIVYVRKSGVWLMEAWHAARRPAE